MGISLVAFVVVGLVAGSSQLRAGDRPSSSAWWDVIVNAFAVEVSSSQLCASDRPSTGAPGVVAVHPAAFDMGYTASPATEACTFGALEPIACNPSPCGVPVVGNAHAGGLCGMEATPIADGQSFTVVCDTPQDFSYRTVGFSCAPPEEARQSGKGNSRPAWPEHEHAERDDDAHDMRRSVYGKAVRFRMLGTWTFGPRWQSSCSCGGWYHIGDFASASSWCWACLLPMSS